jgi:hypothetical protein
MNELAIVKALEASLLYKWWLTEAVLSLALPFFHYSNTGLVDTDVYMRVSVFVVLCVGKCLAKGCVKRGLHARLTNPK